MTTRMMRTLAVGAGVGALVLGMAAPALADDGAGASKIAVPNGSGATAYSVAFSEDVPTTPCPTTVTTWTARTASKNMSAIVVTPAASCANTGPSGGGVITVTVAAGTTAKRNAVVKVIGTSTSDASIKVVKTIVAKVTGKPKPGKGNKPA